MTGIQSGSLERPPTSHNERFLNSYTFLNYNLKIEFILI